MPLFERDTDSSPPGYRGDYLRGRFVKVRSPDGEHVSTSPRDPSDEVGRFPFALAGVDEAVAAARRAQSDWAAAHLEHRVKALRKVKAELMNRASEVEALLVREAGLPRWEAAEELRACLARVDHALGGELLSLEIDRPEGVRARITYRPRGVVALLAGTDRPVAGLNDHVVSALLTGNTVVVVPSPLAPALGQLYAEIVDEADLPRGVFNLVQGDGALATALATHPGVQAILHAGPVADAERLRRAVFPQPWKVLALESDGTNPALVLDDADVDKAVRDVVFGAFAGAGQHRTSTSQALVHRKVLAPFLEGVRLRAEALVVGDPEAPATFMGPLRSEAARQRFLHAVAQGEAEGAEAVLSTGPRALDPPGWYVGPAVHRVPQVLDRSRYQTEVLSGPDLAVFEVHDLDEAVALASSLDRGLAASVFTRDDKRFEYALRRLEYARVNRNAPTTATAGGRVPLFGLKQGGSPAPAGTWPWTWCTVAVATEEGAPALEGAEPLPGPSG